MGLDPLTAGLTIGGAGLSAVSASSRNRAIQGSLDAQERARRVQAQQLSNRSEQERRLTKQQSALTQGQILARAGSAGIATDSGSVLSASRQAAFQEGRALANIQTNLTGALRSSRAATRAQAAGLVAGAQNPILAAFSGGIQGFQAGLSISLLQNQLSQIATSTSATTLGTQIDIGTGGIGSSALPFQELIPRTA